MSLLAFFRALCTPRPPPPLDIPDDYPTWLSMPGSFPQDMPTSNLPVDDISTPDLSLLSESKHPLVPSGQDGSPQITSTQPPPITITESDGSCPECNVTLPSDSDPANKVEDAGLTDLPCAEPDLIAVDIKVLVELKKTIKPEKTATSPAPDPADVFRSALIDAGCDGKNADVYVAVWKKYRTDRGKDRYWKKQIELVKSQAALPKEEDHATHESTESHPQSPTNMQPVEFPPFFFPGPVVWVPRAPFDDEDESDETADAIDARGLANSDAEPASAPCKRYDYLLLPKKMQSLTLGPPSLSTASPATSQLDVMFPVEKLTEMKRALVAASEAKRAAVSAPVVPVVDTPAPLIAHESGDDASSGPYIMAFSPVQEVGEPSEVDEGAVFEVPEKADAVAVPVSEAPEKSDGVVVPASEAPIEDVAKGLDSSAGKLDVHPQPLNDAKEAERVDSQPAPVIVPVSEAPIEDVAKGLDSSASKLDVHPQPLNKGTEDEPVVSKPSPIIPAPGNAQPAEPEAESMAYEPTGAPAVVPNPIPELVDDGVANQDLGELPDGGDGDDPLAAFVGNQSDSDDDMSDDESDLSSIFDDEEMQESHESTDLSPSKDTEATMEDALPDNFNFVGNDGKANLPDSTMDDAPLAKDGSPQPFKFQLAPDLFSNLQKPQAPSAVAALGQQTFKFQLSPDLFSNLQKPPSPSVVATPEQQNANVGSTAGEKPAPVASQAQLSEILERIRADVQWKKSLADSSTSEAKKESPLANRVYEHKPEPQELPTAPLLPNLDESKGRDAVKRASAKGTSISESTRKKPLVESTEKGPSEPQGPETPKIDWPADYGTRFANGPPAHVKVGGVSPASSFGHSTILPASGMVASPQSSVAPPPMPTSRRSINDNDFYPSSTVTPLPQLSQDDAISLITQWMERTETYVNYLHEEESKLGEEFHKIFTGPRASLELDAIVHRMRQIAEFATNGSTKWKDWNYKKVPEGLTKDIIDDIAQQRNRLHNTFWLYADEYPNIMKAAEECKKLASIANKKMGRKPIAWD